MSAEGRRHEDDTTAGGLAVVTRRLIDAFNTSSFDDVESLVDPHVVDHSLPGGFPPGRTGVRRWWEELHEAFDLHVDLEDLIEGLDRVATRMTVYSCHVGTFRSHPATGRACVLTLVSIERFASGRLTERWQFGDTWRAARRLTDERRPTSGGLLLTRRVGDDGRTGVPVSGRIRASTSDIGTRSRLQGRPSTTWQ